MSSLAQSCLNFIGTARSDACIHPSIPGNSKENFVTVVATLLAYFYLSLSRFCSLDPQQFMNFSYTLFVIQTSSQIKITYT